MEKRHRDAARALITAHGGDLYPLDIFAFGASNRSVALLTGFRQMIESRNFICAAALLRLELDTALRFSAAWLVPNPHEFAMAVLGGAQVRALKDCDGKKMTDAHLVSVMKADEPWVVELYKQTSGYIHLSDKHIFNSVTGVKDDGKFGMKVSAVDESIPDHLYLEAVSAFEASADLFLRYLEGWILTKDAGPGREAARSLESGPPVA